MCWILEYLESFSCFFFHPHVYSHALAFLKKTDASTEAFSRQRQNLLGLRFYGSFVPKEGTRNHKNNLLFLRKKTKSAESTFFNPILLFTERERALLLHKFAFCKNVEIQIQVNFNFAGYKKKKKLALKLETNSNKNHNVV